MSHEDQLRLVKDYDVILERCYAQNMGGGKYKSNLADNLELIKEVGYKNVMVDTDGGQTENPHWELALAEYMQYLVDHGIPEEHVYHMTHTIPANQYGIFLYCFCIPDWLFWHGIENKRTDWLLAGQHHVRHPVSITVLQLCSCEWNT